MTKFIVYGGLSCSLFYVFVSLKKHHSNFEKCGNNSCGTLLPRFAHTLALLEISVGQRLFLVNIESCQCLDKARASKSDLRNGLQVSTTLL